MKNTTLLVVALVGLIAVAFFIGTRFAGRYALVNRWNSNRQVASQAFRGKGDRGGMMMGRGFGGQKRGNLQGQITKIEGNAVTLQLPNGGTYNVTLGDETLVSKITKGTNADLQIGQTISVLGGGIWNTTQTILIQP